jgi:hypothetical protein
MVAIGTALVNLISLRRDVFAGRIAAIRDAQKELDDALRAADFEAIFDAQGTLGAFGTSDCRTAQQALLGFCGTDNLRRTFGLGLRERLQHCSVAVCSAAAVESPEKTVWWAAADQLPTHGPQLHTHCDHCASAARS